MSAFFSVSFDKEVEWWFEYHYFLDTLQEKWPDIKIPFRSNEEVGPEFVLFFSEGDPEVEFTEYGFFVHAGIDIYLFASIATWFRSLFAADQHLFIRNYADPSIDEMELLKDTTILEIVYFFERRSLARNRLVFTTFDSDLKLYNRERNWIVPLSDLIQSLKRHWPSVDINDRKCSESMLSIDFTVPTGESFLDCSLNRNGVSCEGFSLRFAEIILWFRQIIPLEQKLFFTDGSSFMTEIYPQATTQEIIDVMIDIEEKLIN